VSVVTLLQDLNRIDLTLDWRTTSETGDDVRKILSSLIEGLNASFSSYDNWQGGADGIKNRVRPWIGYEFKLLEGTPQTAHHQMQ
jgi:hypothetical protein